MESSATDFLRKIWEIFADVAALNSGFLALWSICAHAVLAIGGAPIWLWKPLMGLQIVALFTGAKYLHRDQPYWWMRADRCFIAVTVFAIPTWIWIVPE